MDDPELIELMEEMAVSDMVNSNDLKCFKNELKAKTVQKLQARRSEARDAKAAQKKKKLSAARAKKKAADATRKAKKFQRSKMPLFRPSRRGPATAALPPPDPPLPGPSGHLPPTPVAPEVPPPAGPAVPPPAGPVVPLLAPPSEGHGDWRRLELPGVGWFMYSEKLSRLDSHCMMHSNCRMNRTLRRGCLGLCASWLQATADCSDKDAHDTMKLVLRSQSRPPRIATIAKQAAGRSSRPRRA